MFGVELMGHLQHPEISKTSRYQKYADLCNNAPVNQALDSVLGMALQMPAMQALGKELGVSLENGLSGVVNDVMDVKPKTDEPTNEDNVAS